MPSVIGPHLLGRTPDPTDTRDHPLSLHVASLTRPLPARRRALHLPVVDQGDTPECVAYSASYYRTAQERRDERRTLGWDQPGLYARCKAIDGDPLGDGTSLRAGATVLASTGMQVTASTRKREIGVFRRVSSYARLTSIPDIKAAIAQTRGAWIGVVFYHSWFTPDLAGILPAPDTAAGGHALYLGGWDDARQLLEGINSWSDSWGLSGHFYLPYNYLDSQLQSGDADAWALVDVAHDLAP